MVFSGNRRTPNVDRSRWQAIKSPPIVFSLVALSSWNTISYIPESTFTGPLYKNCKQGAGRQYAEEQDRGFD
jgi:hypothetical protein